MLNNSYQLSQPHFEKKSSTFAFVLADSEGSIDKMEKRKIEIFPTAETKLSGRDKARL